MTESHSRKTADLKMAIKSASVGSGSSTRKAKAQADVMKLAAFIFLSVLTGCSTPWQRTAQSGAVLSNEYWHAPPPASVLKCTLRMGMSGDEFARLVGVAEPAFISCLTAHVLLPDGILSTRHDSTGSLVWWEIEER